MDKILYENVDDGIEKLREHVKLRNLMGGAMYWNITNDQCLCLADRLVKDGADKNLIAEIGDWALKN